MAEDNGIVGKLILSLAVVVAAIPGLIIEPGPISEVVALGVLAAIWLGDETSSEVSDQL